MEKDFIDQDTRIMSTVPGFETIYNNVILSGLNHQEFKNEEAPSGRHRRSVPRMETTAVGTEGQTADEKYRGWKPNV